MHSIISSDAQSNTSLIGQFPGNIKTTFAHTRHRFIASHHHAPELPIISLSMDLSFTNFHYECDVFLCGYDTWCSYFSSQSMSHHPFHGQPASSVRPTETPCATLMPPYSTPATQDHDTVTCCGIFTLFSSHILQIAKLMQATGVDSEFESYKSSANQHLHYCQ